MKIMFVAWFALLVSVAAYGAGSGYSSSNSQNKSLRLYNEGVDLMMDKQFRAAERKFRSVIANKKSWAEAHNNLAYTLRKQGADHYTTALFHYNKAISLAPNLPEPYMYRGVLHVQMGNDDLARKDLNTLLALNSPLATELEFVIENQVEKTPEQFFGVSGRTGG
ncbi:tetratricopeptide repeat protein [Vibrio hangzhouensis]|nr:hypothetical protein [Vibrio hangzhouensis]